MGSSPVAPCSSRLLCLTWAWPDSQGRPPTLGKAGLGLLPAALNPPRGSGSGCCPPCTAPGQRGPAVDQRKAKQRRAQKLQSLWSSNTAADRKNNIPPSAPRNPPLPPASPCAKAGGTRWECGSGTRGHCAERVGLGGAGSCCGAVGMNAQGQWGVPHPGTATLWGWHVSPGRGQLPPCPTRHNTSPGVGLGWGGCAQGQWGAPNPEDSHTFGV